MSFPNEDSAEVFKGRHFNSEILTHCVRWYLTYKLSSHALAEMRVVRQFDVAHSTIMRWVQRSVPEFTKRRQRFAQSMRTSWRVDETYIKLN